MNKNIIIYSETHEHYNLFKDLKSHKDVELVVVKQKKNKSKAIQIIKKIHLSNTISHYISLPFKNIWYEKIDLNIEPDKNYNIIVFDLALHDMDPSFLIKASKLKNVNCYLMFINSMSFNLLKPIKEKMDLINWKSIYTFDENDTKKYGFKKLEFCYYSKNDEIEIKNNVPDIDAYFIGTLYPNRKDKIISLYEKLRNDGLNLEFHLQKTGKQRLEKMPYENEIDYFNPERGRIPYENVLESIQHAKTIIEIVQGFQSGPSLRYYEAVCYNKKLLTNNPDIVNYPLYNPKYMKVFSEIHDIDTDWVKSDLIVEYNYNNEFSPINLLNSITDSHS